MPNGNIHNTAGAILGALTYMIIQNNSTEKKDVDLGELLLSSGIGFSTARIPDILEPAINPNHRNFFHSLIFGGITGYAAVRAFQDFQIRRLERRASEIEKWSKYEYVDIAIMIAAGSVLLHLVMDGFTPKGLPFI